MALSVARWEENSVTVVVTVRCDTRRDISETVVKSKGFTGAKNRDRTDDLLITNQLLYQLSYLGPWGGFSKGRGAL